MKLIVQIPCYNEEQTLPLVIKSIPKKINGIDTVEIMIIDDGSSDNTVEVAKKLGVNHIVRHKKNKGLGPTFYDGIQEALRLGADIIVNTDGDNQYPQKDIPSLIEPVLSGKYDIVVGDRQTQTIAHFSPLKKFLQKLGSQMVNKAAGTHIPDAVSGFRAYSRQAALGINIISSFSYCTETIIHAGKNRTPITYVPVKTNPKTRESRLFKNMRQHIFKSTLTIFRSYAMHEPFKVFFGLGGIIFLLGTIPFWRYLYLVIDHSEPIGGHVQSLLAGSVLLILGFLTVVLGIVADLIAINRKLLEESLLKLRNIQFDKYNKTKKN
jgi:glycosyltransferase involved in cell wall biosynthesis